MAGALSHSHVLVFLLVFSQLISLNAVPVTRIGKLMHGHQVHLVSQNTHMLATVEKWDVQTIARRMDVELNDYPGSGANNRHTPRPPQ
ncbi:Transmembrane protein [Fagus crenata]